MRPVVLAALLPLAAFAQTSTPEPAASPAAPVASAAAESAGPAGWSLGAGVGFQMFGSPGYLSTTLGGLLLPPPEAPTAVASLERRLSGRSWLVVGVDGSYAHDRQDLPPQSTGVTKSDRWSLAVSAGVRHALTSAGAPVDVSIDVLASAGATRWKGDADYLAFGGTGYTVASGSFDQSAWRAGASFGVAVDRELTGALSLRVATPVASVRYTRTKTKVSGQPTQDGEDVGVGLALAPRLELRLAF